LSPINKNQHVFPENIVEEETTYKVWSKLAGDNKDSCEKDISSGRKA
jgi:hypothetical protein